MSELPNRCEPKCPSLPPFSLDLDSKLFSNVSLFPGLGLSSASTGPHSLYRKLPSSFHPRSSGTVTSNEPSARVSGPSGLMLATVVFHGGGLSSSRALVFPTEKTGEACLQLPSLVSLVLRRHSFPRTTSSSPYIPSFIVTTIPFPAPAHRHILQSKPTVATAFVQRFTTSYCHAAPAP